MIICANLWTKNSVEKKAVDLRAASRNHEVPWDINAEPSRVFLKKAVDFRAKIKSVLICDNLWTKNSVDKNNL